MWRSQESEDRVNRKCANGTVTLTKTGLTDPQDDGLAACCEPGMLGIGQPDST